MKDIEVGRGRGKELQTFPSLAISSACGESNAKIIENQRPIGSGRQASALRQPSASFLKFLLSSFENRAGSPEPTLTQGQEGWEVEEEDKD